MSGSRKTIDYSAYIHYNKQYNPDERGTEMEQHELIELLNQMTLQEKMGQMTQLPGQHYMGLREEEIVIEPFYSKEVLQGDTLYIMGSVLGVSSAKVINKIQENYLAQSRLKIPLLFMHDAIHGYQTIYPIPLGLSCSWDEKLLQKVAEQTATELRATGIHVNFSPMIDLVRDARWGRVMESFGEDHVLSGKLGVAMIKGYQKGEDGAIAKDGVAATLKHFGACGGAIAGKEYNTVDMSWREFFDYYGKPYEIAIKEKPRFVMSSFNAFNGMPVTGNEEMMNDVLRERYGFEDLTISDWGSVMELTNHRIASDTKEAATLALKSGTDIEMASATYLENCEEILQHDPDLLHYIDEVVFKILELKNEFGLFEQPYVAETHEADILLNQDFLNFAKESAKRSCVLLKNEHALLPIKEESRNILVIGPFAKTQELLGSWCCEGKFEDVVSIESGMKSTFTDRKIGAYETLEACPKDRIDEADYLVLAIGEHWDLSGEGRSSVNLELENSQKQLIRAVKKLNKPYTCVVLSGRPLALQDIIDDIPSLLWAWYPGTQGGVAIAELLAGIGSPSGKLTMSFPRYSAQTPIYYNEYSSGRPTSSSSYSNRYQDCEIGPLFSFGHGLNYATIHYNNFEISSEVITDDKPVTITFEIENKSAFTTSEIVILYIEDKVSKAIRPVREMKKWQVVDLLPFESKNVSFQLQADDLSYLNLNLEQVVEPGEFNLFVNELQQERFTLRYLERGLKKR